MRYIVMVFFSIVMVGCGSLNPAVAGYGAKVAADTRAANDNLVHGIVLAICAVPIGAVIRNRKFIPIAREACFHGDDGSAALLLGE